MTPPLPPDLEPVAFLVGRWRGEGEGDYPTIEPFRYREETRWWHDGRPFLFYEQRTWSRDDGRPLHAESGMWRVHADGRIECVIAQTGGVSEVAAGAARAERLEVASTSIVLTPSAKEVTAFWRTLAAASGTLDCRLDLAAVGQGRHPHLRARLDRIG